jgi:beta-N-acetylhexosaminidase
MTSRACILSVSGPVLTPAEAAFLREMQPWGIILMGRSCKSRVQVRRLVDDIWTALDRAALIFIDQEGGRVARLKAPEWPRFPPMGQLAHGFNDAETSRRAVWLAHRLMAAELAALGIHADCAPVADVPVPGAHDIIGDRAFGTSAEQVADLGAQALAGLRRGGVAGVIKHIPGHGRAGADSHEALPQVTASRAELAQDFAPFRALAYAPMAMTAHVAYDALDRGVAATLSSRVIGEIIRGEIGFDGLLMGDDLGMAALEGTLTTRAERAFTAGCDVMLHCAGFQADPAQILAEMQEVASACPPLAGRAAERAQAAMAWAGAAAPDDLKALRAEFDGLTARLGALV